MRRGKFITFEGGEGVGKSTQARLLADALRHLGIETIVTREPGGTAGAEEIRRILLSTEGEGWGPRAEALLFAAARSDHVERRIEPALATGIWVICDRYLDSSRAYQGGASGIGDAQILALHAIGSTGLMPDLTLLIEVSPEVAARRIAERDGDTADRIAGRTRAYHEQVAAAFSGLAEREPQRFARIDGDGTVESIHASIVSVLARIGIPGK